MSQSEGELAVAELHFTAPELIRGPEPARGVDRRHRVAAGKT